MLDIASHMLQRSRIAPPGDRDCVIAVVAPAGYGKTTLAAQWFAEAQQSHGAGWLQIDERSRDPAVFIGSLAEALEAECRQTSSDYFGTQDYEEGLQACLEQVQKCVARRLLVVDDAHLLAGSGAMTLFHRLLLSAPPQLIVVLTSRDAEGLGLAPLAQRGRVRWVTDAQLAFSAEEIAALALQGGLALGASDLETLNTATEGWPALTSMALHGLLSGVSAKQHFGGLAGLSAASYVRDCFLAHLTGSERSLVEVLATLPEATPGLLESLSADTEIGKLLERFERIGIVRRHGQTAGQSCYRMHPFVREVAGRGSAIERSGLLTRAAHWWWDRQDSDRAIRMTLLAGMSTELKRWLRFYAPVLVHREGRHETFLGLLCQAEGLWGQIDPELLPYAVSSLMFLRRYDEAERMLDRAATVPPSSDSRRSDSDPAELQRAVIAGLRDDYATAGRYARGWLQRGGGDVFHQGLAWIVTAFAQKCASQFAEAEHSLTRARSLLSGVQATYGIGWSRVIQALSLLKQGHYREVLVETETGMRELAGTQDVADLLALLRATAALVQYERGDLDQCIQSLNAAMPHLHRQGIVDAMIAGYVAAARVQAASGRLAAGLDLLAEGQRVGQDKGFSRLSITLCAERSVMLLREGAVLEAVETARGAGLLLDDAPVGVERDKDVRLRVRLALARGTSVDADALLSGATAHAKESGQRRKLAELRMLEALCHFHRGDERAAGAALTASLEIGLNRGYRRMYLDEGAALREMLLAPQVQSALQPSITQFARELADDRRPASLSAGVEPLSERECEVLQMVSRGLSNQEIGLQLFLSEGTVKWHLHNVYGKLGVGTRTAAVHEARRAGFIG
ncbi:LuxR C-terminal-related transcriptional regulator [Algiphilus sp. W345]|uniref:LuxR C-terminal-related transcriptional regulator n=1 Tax=Banduia mediterranea TaxID=3075609 RepID=A0ABU2WN29_9GAMM|nr:LuxR C-terminal-related transcriptional regulator [Algiphilus sp. W345]MDT0499266.1 LuxR C-terminal-related transcriptional regulator [Algiphilus sp. W345]